MKKQVSFPQSPAWNDIIFERRNKAYGAYALRSTYDKRVLMGFVFSSGLLILLTTGSSILNWLGLSSSTLPQVKVYEDPWTITECTFPEKEKLFIEEAKGKEAPPSGGGSQKADAPIVVSRDSLFLGPDITEDTAGTQPTGSGSSGLPIIPGGGGGKPGDEGNGSGGNGDGQEMKVIEIPEEMPQFPGGDEALFKFLKRNLRYPKIPLQERMEAVVYVAFVVKSDGSIGEVSMIKAAGFGFDEEVTRVVKKMPEWKPGLVNGQPVPVLFKMPVRFKLNP